MNRLAMAVALAATLPGCMTAHELRNRPVDLSMTIDGPYDLIAECVASRSDDSGQPPTVMRIDRPAKKAYVFQPVNHIGDASYDITFMQNGERTTIEARGMPTIYGSDFYPNKIWPTVRQCANDLAPRRP